MEIARLDGAGFGWFGHAKRSIGSGACRSADGTKGDSLGCKSLTLPTFFDAEGIKEGSRRSRSAPHRHQVKRFFVKPTLGNFGNPKRERGTSVAQSPQSSLAHASGYQESLNLMRMRSRSAPTEAWKNLTFSDPVGGRRRDPVSGVRPPTGSELRFVHDPTLGVKRTYGYHLRPLRGQSACFRCHSRKDVGHDKGESTEPQRVLM